MKNSDTMRAARALTGRINHAEGQDILAVRFQCRGGGGTVPVTAIPARFQPAAPDMPVQAPAEPVRHAAWNAFGR